MGLGLGGCGRGLAAIRGGLKGAVKNAKKPPRVAHPSVEMKQTTCCSGGILATRQEEVHSDLLGLGKR